MRAMKDKIETSKKCTRKKLILCITHVKIAKPGRCGPIDQRYSLDEHKIQFFNYFILFYIQHSEFFSWDTRTNPHPFFRFLQLYILPITYCILLLKYDTYIKCLGSSVSLLLWQEHKQYFNINVPMLFPYFCISALIHNSIHCLHLWSSDFVAKNEKNICLCGCNTALI